MSENITDLIKKRLAVLEADTLILEDESSAHRAHLSNEKGGGHFKLTIRSKLFIGKSLIERHRMVYDALDGLIGHAIHAIQITAL